jgi:hypothetical protein
MFCLGSIQEYWKVVTAGIFILSVCGCQSSVDSPNLEVRIQPTTVLWLSAIPVPDRREPVKISATICQKASGTLRGLNVLKKTCGCFDVKMQGTECTKDQEIGCSVIVPPIPMVGRDIGFTISGFAEDGTEVTSNVACKLYLLPEWQVRNPVATFRTRDGVMSVANLIVDRYHKHEIELTQPRFGINNVPEALSISGFKETGHRRVIDEIFVTEYEVCLVAAPALIPKDPLFNGIVELTCSEDSAGAFQIQYQVVNHDPCFVPATILFADTVKSTNISRTVKLNGLTELSSIRLVTSNSCFSAALTSDSTPGNASVCVTFSPAEIGLHEGQIFVESLGDSRRICVLTLRGQGIVADSDGTN